MFEVIDGLLKALFGDMTKTFRTIFILGIMVCALGAAFGGEDNQGKFKRGLMICIIGLIVFFLAPKIVEYFDKNTGGSGDTGTATTQAITTQQPLKKIENV